MTAHRRAAVRTFAEVDLLPHRGLGDVTGAIDTLVAPGGEGSYPRVRVEPDRIFVRDGAVWTSAGVTAGMDLALALVEEDHGRAPARFVERVRVEAARRHLEDSSAALDDVAARSGFRTAEVMRRAFHRTGHVSPAAYRRGFRGGV